MRLNLFNGGLNERLSPSLLQPNEAVMCTNVDVLSGSLQSAADFLGLGTELLPYSYYYKGAWVESATPRDYLEYQGKLFWTDGVEPRKFDGTTESRLGIAPPTTKLTVTNIGQPTGDIVQYTYTFYNVNDGTESAPAPVTDEIEYPDDRVTLGNIEESLDPQVTHIKIYRVGGPYLLFTEMVELANGTTEYQWFTYDEEPLLGGQLESESWTPPPNELRWISQVYGTFMGSVGPRLYFSIDVGNPNYWPAENYIDFYEDITGVTEAGNGILVFTENKTYALTGTSPQTFVKHLVSADQGCIEGRTIATIGATAIWLSKDGVCASNGSQVDIISKDKLGFQDIPGRVAVAYKEVYYLQLNTGEVLAIDMRFKMTFSRYFFGSNWLLVGDNVLYGLDANNFLYQWFSGPLAQYEYKTGKLVDTLDSELKAYETIYVRADGRHTMHVSISGEQVATFEMDNEYAYEFTVPQAKQLGYDIQFHLVGTGTVYEIEYKVVGRDNGK